MKLVKNSVVFILLLFICNAKAAPSSVDSSEIQSKNSAKTKDKVLLSEISDEKDRGYHYEYADSRGTFISDDAAVIYQDENKFAPEMIKIGRVSYIDENGVRRNESFITNELAYYPVEKLDELDDEDLEGPSNPDEEDEIDPNALKSLIG